MDARRMNCRILACSVSLLLMGCGQMERPTEEEAESTSDTHVMFQLHYSAESNRVVLQVWQETNGVMVVNPQNCQVRISDSQGRDVATLQSEIPDAHGVFMLEWDVGESAKTLGIPIPQGSRLKFRTTVTGGGTSCVSVCTFPLYKSEGGVERVEPVPSNVSEPGVIPSPPVQR